MFFWPLLGRVFFLLKISTGVVISYFFGKFSLPFLVRFKKLFGFIEKVCRLFGLTFYPTEKLFKQIAKLHNLMSLEIEFLNFSSFSPEAEKDLEAILNQLPVHVTKKCVFSRPNHENNSLANSNESSNSFEENDIHDNEQLLQRGERERELLPGDEFFEF